MNEVALTNMNEVALTHEPCRTNDCVMSHT